MTVTVTVRGERVGFVDALEVATDGLFVEKVTEGGLFRVQDGRYIKAEYQRRMNHSHSVQEEGLPITQNPTTANTQNTIVLQSIPLKFLITILDPINPASDKTKSSSPPALFFPPKRKSNESVAMLHMIPRRKERMAMIRRAEGVVVVVEVIAEEGDEGREGVEGVVVEEAETVWLGSGPCSLVSRPSSALSAPATTFFSFSFSLNLKIPSFTSFCPLDDCCPSIQPGGVFTTVLAAGRR